MKPIKYSMYRAMEKDSLGFSDISVEICVPETVPGNGLKYMPIMRIFVDGESVITLKGDNIRDFLNQVLEIISQTSAYFNF